MLTLFCLEHIFCSRGSDFSHAVCSLRMVFAQRPCTYLLLISWSVNQGEKLGWKTKQLKDKRSHLTMPFISFPPLHMFAFLSLLSPLPRASSSFMWETCFSDLLPAIRGPGRTWPYRSPWGPTCCETLAGPPRLLSLFNPLLLNNNHLKEACSLCNAAFNYLSSAELALTCRELILFHCLTVVIRVFVTLNANSCHAACHTAPYRADTRLTVHAKF